MAHIPSVENFNEELQSLLSIKPPVSVTKITSITRAAIKAIKFHKHIVYSVERFISKCPTEYKLPGLYVIDSIVKNSIGQYKERDVYADRFARNLQQTFGKLFYNSSHEEKAKMIRVLSMWEKNQLFNPLILKPIIEMAETNSFRAIANDTLSAESPYDDNVPVANTELLLQHLSDTIARVKDRRNDLHTAGGTSKDSHQFKKSNLNHNTYNNNDDDDDDDGDETPTEAEPPLSTTLSKIEQEQRRKINPPVVDYHPTNKSISTDCRSGRQPVLERWNRLIGQTSTSSNLHEQIDKIHEPHRYSRSRSRSRSRSVSTEPTNNYNKRYANHDISRSRSVSPELEFNDEILAERKKKGLPSPRKGYLTICSSTLWLGHVPKNIGEADISNAFGEYGTINRIDLIPPRGCAYVCMDRRQDAMKALQESRKLKINGNHIKLAWAPGKGLKDKKFKDFWEVDVGASFIPISKIDRSTDMDNLEEGGVIDEATMTSTLKDLRDERINDLLTPNSNNPLPPVSLPTIISQATTFPINTFAPTALPQLPMHFGGMQSLPPEMLENLTLDNMARIAPTMIPIPDPNIFSAPPPMLSMPGAGIPYQMYQNPQAAMYQAPPPLLVNNQPHRWPPMLPPKSDINQRNDSPNRHDM